jgi:hypothetical protein
MLEKKNFVLALLEFTGNKLDAGAQAALVGLAGRARTKPAPRCVAPYPAQPPASERWERESHGGHTRAHAMGRQSGQEGGGNTQGHPKGKHLHIDTREGGDSGDTREYITDIQSVVAEETREGGRGRKGEGRGEEREVGDEGRGSVVGNDVQRNTQAGEAGEAVEVKSGILFDSILPR